MSKTKPKKGQLLIAKPSILGDLSFNRSVVLLAEHTTQGSVGFILNKPMTFSLSHLIDDCDFDFAIYNGGPVEQDNLYFIHKQPNLISDSIPITPEVYWGGNFEDVLELISKGILKENDIKFFLGYTGWDKNQLEKELQYNSWHITENCNEEIFNKINATFWKEKMVELGGEYTIWSNAPENPNYN